MPTYNRESLILETIESIRKQTYANWELIIVDDGSDDNTEQVIRELRDERIRFIKAGRTGVGGKIKNTGIRETSGELIAFIDSDDLWAPEKLEKQVTVLQQYNNAGFCVTGGYNFKTTGQPIDFFYKEQTGMKYGNVFEDFFRSELAAFTQALIFRKQCLAVTGYFKEQKSFSDIDFIISLALNFEAVLLYEPLVFRRLHEANYITPNWEKSYYEGIGIIREYQDKLPVKTVEKALFRTYINFGEKCLLYGQRRKAISRFFKAWQYKPFSIVPLKKTGKAMIHLLKSK